MRDLCWYAFETTFPFSRVSGVQEKAWKEIDKINGGIRVVPCSNRHD
jgi:hypothetical protein